MPEEAVNKPRSAQECVETAIIAVNNLVSEGACVDCALRVIAKRYAIASHKLDALYWESIVGPTSD